MRVWSVNSKELSIVRGKLEKKSLRGGGSGRGMNWISGHRMDHFMNLSFTVGREAIERFGAYLQI